MSDEADVDSEENSSEWEEMEAADDGKAFCLFCNRDFSSCQETFDHCKMNHSFDIVRLKEEFNLNCFSYIRLINYIRKERPVPDSLNGNKELQVLLTTNDEYMKPQLNDDLLLMFDIDSLDASCVVEKTTDVCLSVDILANSSTTKQQSPNSACRPEGKSAMLEEHFGHLVQRVSQVKDALDELDTRCDQDAAGDGYYFDSYAHVAIHHEMLQDRVRTLSYRDALYKNRAVFEGKTVLDIGCGTAILSMFAAQSGATKVFAVDNSDVVYQAMDIVRENGLDDCITLLKGRMEDITLPHSPVDVIISEWMGYFLLFECMLDTVVHARDKHLATEGIMLPNRCSISVAGVSDLDAHSKLISFWDDVYGFRMSCLQSVVTKEATVELVGHQNLITESALVYEIDLMTCVSSDVEFSAMFQLKVIRDGLMTAVVGWFDVCFDLPEKVSFSTSPDSKETHWKQTVFYLKKPMQVDKGSSIDGRIWCRRLPKDTRALQIQLTLSGVSQSYILQ